MTESFFHTILKRICNEKGIEVEILSFGMIIKLKKEDKIKYIIQNCFGFNDSASYRLASDKYALYDVLKSECIPVVEHYMLFNPTSKNYYDELSFNNTINEFMNQNGDIAILKPNNGKEGINVFKCVGKEEIYNVSNYLFKTNFSISLCPYYDIKEEYRVIYLNGKCELVYSKQRPSVIGDGASNVMQLYLKQKENLSTYITIDKIVNVDLNYVPKKNEKVYLTWKHNLYNGSMPLIIEDVKIKSKIEEFAIKVAKIINIEFAAIDIIQDQKDNLFVLEVNSGLGMTIFSKYIPNGYKITKDIYSKALDKLFE